MRALILAMGVTGLVVVAWGTFSKDEIGNKEGFSAVLPTRKDEKLPTSYLVTFGEENAPIKITEYFSFICPYCLKLFREEFPTIKRDYIDTGMVQWTFHPVPMDLVTIQAMDCLEKLSVPEKRAFLQVFLEEAEYGNPDFCTAILKKGMEILQKPVGRLNEQNYLENTPAFSEAYRYVSSAKAVEAVPSVEVNGSYVVGAVPDLRFVSQIKAGERI